jgi:IS30 family transposase
MSKHLTQAQRYYICLRIASFDRVKNIAKVLNVSKSTIYREIKRNKSFDGCYDSSIAQKKSILRRVSASKSKSFKKLTPKVGQYIVDKLKLKWSPEQISGRMKQDIKVKVSYKTIYNFIKKDKLTGGVLFKLLSHQGKRYRYNKVSIPRIINRVDISKRPKIVDKKRRIGDFEIDTVVSAKNTGKSCLLTMVDRKSKVLFVRKVLDKSALAIQNAIEYIYQNTLVPFKTLTSDNGTEFAYHYDISKNIGCDFYFARPYQSCDRGLNEHTNGLIRKYLPKGTNFDTITNEEIEQIQNSINNRPRKALNYKTPNEVISKYLQRVKRNLHNSKKYDCRIS